jgi:hypothetical protein
MFAPMASFDGSPWRRKFQMNSTMPIVKSDAADMANVIHAKINGVEQARYDFSKLTPEQRARYASYKAAETAR